MQPNHELLKIGDFARLADTNLRTLRYYEELGLLTPASRSQGGFRYYRRTDINRVQMIRDLQELGLHLDRIRELISARAAEEPRDQFLARVRLALEEQDRLLSIRMAALEEQRKKVAQALHKIGECRHCVQMPRLDNNFCEPCTTTGERLPEHLSALYQ
ncbi:MAG: MerR family transcriptional regulator [Planctomycetota bacterium]|nr:MerR family transcriptional regulator [Planctomycetota bacterium]